MTGAASHRDNALVRYGGRGSSGGLERLALDVAGVRRTYWLARAPGSGRPAPLLMMLHGSGTSGRDIATTFTGLATRGPTAGVTVVCPDGWRGVWHVTGTPPGQPDLDDVAFLRALTSRLQGEAPPQPVFLAGLSNGAGFAEHVARHGLLPIAGLFLVSGTIREASRQAVPVPAQRTAVTLMAGTADPMAAYHGGALHARGWTGSILRRRAAFAELPSRCQQLLSMLISDPPHSYADIHAELGIPVGSIGPQRARCLDRMRRSGAFAALGEDEAKINLRGGEPGA